jgi:hypothetical protein
MIARRTRMTAAVIFVAALAIVTKRSNPGAAKKPSTGNAAIRTSAAQARSGNQQRPTARCSGIGAGARQRSRLQ